MELLDVAFEYGEHRESAGSIEARFVADLRAIDNPEWARAQAELKVTRAEAERAKVDLEAALPEARDGVRIRLEIAEGKRRRAACAAKETPPTIPSPVWERRWHPVERVLVDGHLSLQARIDGEVEVLRASVSAKDLEVAGDVGGGIAPTRPDVPPRAEALAILARRVAEDLGRRIAVRGAARKLQLLQDARQRIAEDSFEAAVENLMAFLYAERAPGQPGSESCEAAELVAKLTGCIISSHSSTKPAGR